MSPSRTGAVTSILVCIALMLVRCEPLPAPLQPEEVPDLIGGQWCYNISEPDPYDHPACCAVPVFDSIEDCEAAVVPYIQASIEAAVDAGLELSEDCVRDMSNSECPDQSTGSFLACESDCQIMFGDKPEGAECEAIGHRMSDCEQGLVCAADRTCRDPCSLSFVAPEGGYCGPARGMWFVSCDAGLECAQDGTCQLAQALGDPCDALMPCAIGSWCDDGGSCVAKLEGGSACEANEQCASDICTDAACYEPGSFVCGRSAW